MAIRKQEFMEWLDGEIARRGREQEVAALIDEMLVEEQLASCGTSAASPRRGLLD